MANHLQHRPHYIETFFAEHPALAPAVAITGLVGAAAGFTGEYSLGGLDLPIKVGGLVVFAAGAVVSHISNRS